MDKRIHMLIFLVGSYFIITVTAVFFVPFQKFITMFLFGTSGILIFLGFFGLWILKSQKD